MNKESLYERLGKAIIKLRKERKISQESLALSCHIDRSYLAEIEAGKANPSLKILNKIARALDYKIWQLVKDI